MKMQVYLEGRAAYRAGLVYCDCPYANIYDSRRSAWYRGWNDEQVGAPLASESDL